MSPSSATKRRGLTLVELLVVLVILVLLAGLAIQSTEQVLERGRQDTTQRLLDNARTGLFQKEQTGFGSQAITGYVADVGALPANPIDLIIKPAAVNNFSTNSAGTGLIIGSGWRGPYLQVPPGFAVDTDTDTVPDVVLDFFGNPLQFQIVGSTIEVVSLGPDGVLGLNPTTMENDDLSSGVSSSIGMVQVTIATEAENGEIMPAPDGTDVIYEILLYEPNGTGGVNADPSMDIDSPGAYSVFSNKTVGFRGLQATISDSNGVLATSRPATVLILPNGTTQVDLIFTDDPTTP